MPPLPLHTHRSTPAQWCCSPGRCATWPSPLGRLRRRRTARRCRCRSTGCTPSTSSSRVRTRLECGRSVFVPVLSAPTLLARGHAAATAPAARTMRAPPLARAGEGVPLRLELSDPSQRTLAFGAVPRGQSSARTLAVTNRGRAPVALDLGPAADMLARRCLEVSPAGGLVLRPREEARLSLFFRRAHRCVPAFSTCGPPWMCAPPGGPGRRLPVGVLPPTAPPLKHTHPQTPGPTAAWRLSARSSWSAPRGCR